MPTALTQARLLDFKNYEHLSRRPVIPRRGTTRQDELAGEAAQAKENPEAEILATPPD